MKHYYKIVDFDIKGNIKTLFHGVNGSKIIPKQKWTQAILKPVTDGSAKTVYMSGWHVLKTMEECLEYLTRFKHVSNKAIIKCKIDGKIWPKSHSNADVYLAEFLYYEEIVWINNLGP